MKKLLVLTLMVSLASPLLAKKAVHITRNQDFKAQIAQGNVIVDFHAQWCGPCKKMSPIIDTLASECTNVTFIKVDTEVREDLSNEYGVMSLPTFIFFKDGKKVLTKTGSMSKKELKNLIDTTF